MSKKYSVTVKGTGQLNGPVRINKTIELDENVAKTFTGSKKESVITDFCKTHYPGVKIEPRSIGVNIVAVKTEKPKEKTTIDTKSSSSNSKNVKSFVTPVIISEPELSKEEQLIIEKERIENEKRLESDRLRIKEEELKLEQIKLNKKLEMDLMKQKREDSRVDKLNSVIEFKPENTQEALTKHLDELLVNMSGFSLSKDKNNENYYFDRMFNKYKLCLEKLKSLSVNEESYKFYQKESKRIRNRRFLNKVVSFRKSLDNSND